MMYTLKLSSENVISLSIAVDRRIEAIEELYGGDITIYPTIEKEHKRLLRLSRYFDNLFSSK